jgi:hypothetical protein
MFELGGGEEFRASRSQAAAQAVLLNVTFRTLRTHPRRLVFYSARPLRTCAWTQLRERASVGACNARFSFRQVVAMMRAWGRDLAGALTIGGSDPARSPVRIAPARDAKDAPQKVE